ncbi:hypothetical protein EV586_11210 [Tumebacillus sp. BK434]|uniref:anti-sigma factor family protein n=1 Tax=Tumebacillus sp. BK434 TaxID=2512169 RepID=UPI00104A4958|nr:hypothetical protein [Tumebacillus sp. BK434]TCP52250.1 hypothetical protein EV586_11210 [Tumebacillus sp. BK434]
MNCSQVQEKIWCGDLQPDVHMHLATCAACREELQRVQQVNLEIEHTAIPLPSRSLLPSREEIEAAVGQHKRKKSRLPAWMTSGTVAAAILLAVTQSGLFQHRQAADSTAVSDQNAAGKVPPISHMANFKAPSSRSLNDVRIDPAGRPAFREETESIRAYLDQSFDPIALQALTIESYTRDTTQPDTQTGRFSLWVQNQLGQTSVYGKGDRPFRTQHYVELQKIQGQWTVTKLSDIPFDFTMHRASGYQIALPANWQSSPSQPMGSLTFHADGKTLGGVTVSPLVPGVSDPFKAVQLPKGTTVIQSGLETYRTEDAVKYLLKRTGTSPDRQTEIHTYFLRGKVAYDVWLTSDPTRIPSETALAITNSFQTAP